MALIAKTLRNSTEKKLQQDRLNDLLLDKYTVARKRMLQELIRGGIHDQALLLALEKVPRHHFVESGMAEQVYTDRTIPIGCGQTLSQVSTVAFMLHDSDTRSSTRGQSPRNRHGLWLSQRCTCPACLPAL